MNNKGNKYIILLMLIAVVITSCKNQWDKHNVITDPALNINLLAQINQNPNLSMFSQYLVKTGYDKVISSSKTFTIWAPNNAAIQAAQAIDPTVLTDTTKLKSFIGNHISFQSYTTSMPQPSLRVKMLNGKSATFTKNTFEEANILQADNYVSNGIIHVIDQGILPKLNIWDYVKRLTSVGLNQKAYLLSQNYPHQDSTRATVLSIDPLTGKPVYDPNSGIDTLNHYLDNTQNLKSEDNQYTYFVLSDDAFNSETNKVSKYFKTNDPVASANLTNFSVTKDLALPGLYTPNNLPDTLLSPFNVKVPINKIAILSSYKASNGIVYVIGANNNISGINFRLQDKFPPIVIQGEKPTAFSSNSFFGDIYTRNRVDQNGVPFNDILIDGFGSNGTLPIGFYVRYNTVLNSISYKYYCRAINTTATTFRERVDFGFPDANGIYVVQSANPYFSVLPLNYSEVYLGTLNVNQYTRASAFVVNDNTTNTKGLNSITLDYLKLVPVLQ